MNLLDRQQSFSAKNSGRYLAAGLIALFSFVSSESAFAHVKWFSDFSFADKPNGFTEVLTPTFYWLALLSMVVIALMVMVEQWLAHKPWMKRLDGWLASNANRNVDIMRLGMGATLLWAWQAGTLLAPELKIENEKILWLEFLMAFLLVFPKTCKWTGAGLIVLYLYGISKFGFFYMLDYLLFAGIGYFFIAVYSKKESLRRTALPSVYATVGFCLIWLGIEKLVYPSWSKVLLEQHPVLALGFEHDFFVVGAAFVEISLGFMIMACLQQRLLALTLTIIFLLTTTVFGRQEVVGHTLIHAVLAIFLIAGVGFTTPPIEWLPRKKLHAPAAAILFAVFLGVLMVPYIFGAKLRYETLASQHAANPEKLAQDSAHSSLYDVSNSPQGVPELGLAIHKDTVKGWNLELITENFVFSPESTGTDPRAGRGHAHLHINGKKEARIYGRWFHLDDLPTGTNEIEVTLNANNHATLSVNGQPIRAEAVIEVAKKGENLAARN